MLVQFNFKNYKSFKNETTLDMTAASIKEHSHNLIETPSGDKLVKTVAIYGANASGKSNVVSAYQFMNFMVITSMFLEQFGKQALPENSPLPRYRIEENKFQFDEEGRKSPSEFEVFFVFKDTEYQYGFSLENEKVYEEWLYAKSNRSKNYSTLFERSRDKIKCGSKMKDAEKFIDSVGEKTLFLSLTAQTKVEQAKIVYNWFLTNGVISFGDSRLETMLSNLPIEKLKDENYRRKCEEFLKAIDTGIEGIRVEEVKQNTDSTDKVSYKIYSKHKKIGSDEFVEIPFTEESSGTQKMLSLFSFLIGVINSGNTLFIDELDAKLHPLLLRYVIRMFHKPEINKNNAQLIYTTHDIYTLTKDLFRRDQIWFTEKDKDGVSSLYSLVEFKFDDDKKVRNDATYNKEYVMGRYGAIPLLKEFDIIGGN